MNKHIKWIIGAFALIVFVFAVAYLYKNESLFTPEETPVSEEQVKQLLNGLALSFQENRGQVDEVVKYLVRNGGTSIFFTPEEVVFSITERSVSEDSQILSPRERAAKKRESRETEDTVSSTVIRQKFMNANGAVTISGEDEQEGKVNYFIGNDPDKWVQGASTFAKIRYEDLYDGIDLVYSGKSSQLKYEYLVSPHADPSQIQLLIEGADKISLNPDGTLVLQTAQGNLGIKPPETYQLIDGEKKPVESSYQIIDDSSYGFVLGEYDASYELIIDPYVAWSTYVGGNIDDEIIDMVRDTSGDLYVVGKTTSTNLTPTSGHYQENFAGDHDVFVVKLNSTGTSFVYATYLGTTKAEDATGIAVHSDGSVYISGTTTSDSFPMTPGVIGEDFDSNGFLTRLDADGDALIFSTYTHGSADALAIDSVGNAILAEDDSWDEDWHTTGEEGFGVSIVKINSTGTGRIFARQFISGVPYDVEVDDSGNIYVAGTTTANVTDVFPENGYQTAAIGISGYALLIKTNSTGVIQYISYLGTEEGAEIAYGVVPDPLNAGHVYLAGTAVTGFPTKNPLSGNFPDAYSAAGVHGGRDAFIAKFNTTTTGENSLVWSSLFGGGASDWFYGVDADSAGNVYAIGQSNLHAQRFPVTANAAQPTPNTVENAEGDFVVVKVNPAGDTLLYSSYHRLFGGAGADQGRAIVVDDTTQTIYGAGRVNSVGMGTNGAIRPTFLGGVYDGLVFAMTTRNSAPRESTVVSPTDGTTVTNTSVQLVAKALDDDAGSELVVDFRVSSTGEADCLSDGAGVVASGSSSTVSSNQNASFIASGLSDGTTYYWCVRTSDGEFESNNGDFSFMGSFTVSVPSLLEYSTVLGGANGSDFAYGIDVDSNGNIYLFGETDSDDFPATPGSAQDTIPPSGSVGFVAKLSPEGNGASDLVYATYIGGTDCATYLTKGKVDAAGNAYVTGGTCDTDYPVLNEFQASTPDFSGDAVLSVLSPSGAAFIYSTVLGGNSDWEYAYSMDVTDAGVAYLVGEVGSLEFPVTANAYDETGDNSNWDAFLSLIDTSQSGAASLAYSTFLGPDSDYEFIADVAIDGSGRAILFGETSSVDFPTSVNAFDTSHNGNFDLFVTIINPAGSGASDLIYSTFLGGTASDTAGGVFHGSNGDIYLAGSTQSNNFPVTAGAYDESYESGEDWVIARLNPGGNGTNDLVYSTYISSSASNDNAEAIAVDSSGSIYVTGRTSSGTSSNFPVTPDAFDSTFETSSNGVIVKLDPGGNGSSDLLFSSYFGGSGSTSAWDMAIDGNGDIYIGGQTSSAGYQTTAGAYDETQNNTTNFDTFAMKLAFGSFSPAASLPVATQLGGSDGDQLAGVGVDTHGNIIAIGSSSSADFPVASAMQPALAGTNDIVVFKLNEQGTGILVSTYFGGDGNDGASAGRVDENGNVYIAGISSSTDFFVSTHIPDIAGHDMTPDPFGDAYVAKLNEDLDTVLFATYLGGSGSEFMFWKSMHASDGLVAISGSTYSTDFPLTANAFDTTEDEINGDVFVALIDTTLSGASSLVYSSYAGGSDVDDTWGITADSDYVYVVGETYSSDFPAVTAGAFDSDLDNVNGDGFLLKIDPSGTSVTSLAYGTFIGGTDDYDSAFSAAVNQQTQEVYVCGTSHSTDLPTTNNAYSKINAGGNGDMFFYRMSLNGNGEDDLIYGTYLGGTKSEWCGELHLSEHSLLTFVGSGGDSFPVTSDAFSMTHAGGVKDLIIGRFNAVGGGLSDLVHATYFGGSGSESDAGAYLDLSNDRFYVSAYTSSPDLETEGGAVVFGTGGGGNDGFVAAFDLPEPANFSAPSAPTEIFIHDTDAQSGSSNPTGITSTNPVFSAICNDPDIGDVMNAYRVQVDDTDSTFASIIWDSGKQSMADCVDGNRSQNINFGGAALAQDGSTYYVRIKFWDDSDTEGEYSTSADSFTMGSPAPAPSQSDGISQQQRQQIQEQNEQNQQSIADESNDEESAEEEPIDEPVEEQPVEEEPVDEPIEEEAMEEPAEEAEEVPVAEEETSEPVVEKPVEQESVPAPTQEEVGQVDQVVDRLIEDEIGIPVDDLEEPAAPEPQTITTVSSDGESFTLEVVREQGGEEQEALLVTGIARVGNGQIEFSGTTSQPNSTVTLIFNGNITVIVVSDDEGFWQTYVSAEQLGLLPGERVNVSVQVIASKGNLLSDRVSVGGFTVERGANEQIVEADFETIAAPNELSAFINAVTNKVEEIIQDREEEIQQTLTVAAPVVVISSAPLWGYLPYLPTLLYHAITYLVGLVGRRKKGQQRFFGIAYDAITKDSLALAIVRLYKKDGESERLVSTFVTDKQGKYDALLEPGSYRIEVKKPQYTFPSSIVSGIAQDGKYDHVYQGGIEITDQTTELIVPDLPMDPVNMEQKWQTANVFKKIWLSFQKAGHFLALPLLFVGSLASVVVVAAVPENPINWILSAAYVLMFLLQLKLRQKSEKAWGIVYDIATNAPLPLVNLQLIDPAFGKVVASRLSDYQGRFRFAPEPGKYVLKAEKEGYAQTEVVEEKESRALLESEIDIRKEGETVKGDLALRRVND